MKNKTTDLISAYFKVVLPFLRELQVFVVKNCGAYAAEQFDLLLKKLLERDADFFQAKQIIKKA